MAHFIAGGGVAHVLDPLRLARDRAGAVAEALALAEAQLPSGPVLIYSTAEPMAVAAVQAQLGTEGAGALVEQALAEVAQGLLRLGVRQLVVAGGETSGPWCRRWACGRCRLAHRSTPACRGATHSATTGRCTWR